MWLGFQGKTFPNFVVGDEKPYYLKRTSDALYAVDVNRVLYLETYKDEEIDRYISQGDWTEIVPEKWAVDKWESFLVSNE